MSNLMSKALRFVLVLLCYHCVVGLFVSFIHLDITLLYNITEWGVEGRGFYLIGAVIVVPLALCCEKPTDPNRREV